MAWTDADGTVHPSMGDVVTAEGLEHMDACDVCSGRRQARMEAEQLPESDADD